MIQVWRICQGCHRKFAQWHHFGGYEPLAALCPGCRKARV